MKISKIQLKKFIDYNERIVKKPIRFTNLKSDVLDINFIKRYIMHNKYGLFLLILCIFFLIPDVANAAGGMPEFKKIGVWIQENLQGTLGYALSMISILVLAFGFMTNPSKILMIPPTALLTTIWIAPSIINGLFV